MKTKKFKIVLEQLTTEEPQIAKEDIVVYTELQRVYEPCPEYNGKVFVAELYDERIWGRISIENDVIFLCQDAKSDGMECKDKKGHIHSWELGANVTNLIINGKKAKEYFIVPFEKTVVKIGETHKSRLTRIFYYGCSYKISEGIRSYVNAPLKGDLKRNEILVQCIVPKGARYYEGDFVLNESIASDIIKYVKII